jgi:tetratricopeptide (TPR) repeat protein
MAPDEPTMYFAHYQRGMAYRALGAYAAAKADLELAIERLPSLPDDLLRSERPKAYLLLARILTDRAKMLPSKSDYEAAEAILTKALAFDDQKKLPLYLQRGEVRRLRGDQDGKRRDWDAMLTLDPVDEADWTDRGLARAEAKDYAGALADFDIALKLNPTFHRALQNKASVLSEDMAKPEEALTVLNEIVDRYPDYNRARLGRGVLLARHGKRTEAHADAVAALARDHAPMTLYQAANIYALTSRQVPADAERVLPLLAAALFSDEALLEIDNDSDMKPVRDQVWFKQVVDVVRKFKDESSDSERKLPPP